jgi:hypothetical protein
MAAAVEEDEEMEREDERENGEAELWQTTIGPVQYDSWVKLSGGGKQLYKSITKIREGIAGELKRKASKNLKQTKALKN